MANHAPFDELAAVYALGALEGEELEQFLAHLRAGCAECERLLAEDEATLLGMASELATPPPADVKRALFARLDAPATPGTRRPRLLVTIAGMALAAGVAAIVVGAALRAQHATQLADVERQHASELARAEEQRAADLARVEQQLAAEREVRALLEDPATRVVRLGGLPPSPQAEARVVWHPKRGGLFVSNALPPTPPGKAYELWAIAGGAPRPAGVFRVDAQGVGRLTVAPLPDAPTVDVFAVTLEPEGGVPAPTGAMYLASS